MTTETTKGASAMARLSKHGLHLQSCGWLPKSIPAIFRIRHATKEDNVSSACPFVIDDYDGNGVVAVKPEEFEFIWQP